MKKTVIVILAFLLLASPLAIAVHSVSVSVIKNEIFANETAVFRIAVRNPLETIEQYSIYSPDVEWVVTTEPSKDYIIKVYPNSATETLVKVTPYYYTKAGLYGVTLNVKGLETNEVISKKLIVEIKSSAANFGQYIPSLHLDVNIPEQVDPRNTFKVRVDLVNQNTLDLAQVELEVSSSIFKQDYTTSLKPLEAKSVDFSISLDPNQPPVKDLVKVVASTKRNGKAYQFDSFPVDFSVIDYGKVIETRSVQSGILKTVTKVNLENDGNAERQYPVNWRRSLLSAIFTYSNPKPQIVTLEGKKYYQWAMVLGPKESAQITVTVNYWPLVIFILAALLVTAMYYILRSPIVVRKSSQIVAFKHGGISEIKIQLDIINRGKVSLRNVHIIDKLPNLLDFQKEAKLGMVEPDSVLRHERKGTILKWKLGTLEPFEERVLTYSAISRLSILGGLSLSRSFVSYDRDGIEGNTNSNVLYLKMG
ncbi:MAG: hypothetical protein V1837_05195 [Candidatus Woesearchaeota archaeon]